MAVYLPLESTNAAEITLNGIGIQSQTFVNEFACDGYSVLLKEDRFLYDFEVDIEKSSAVILPGFLGNNATVGVTAYVKKNGLEYPVPDMTKNYQNDGLLLDDGRIYLPTLAYCMDNRSFLLSVWSGGNCEQCELLIRYAIDLTGHIIEVDAPTDAQRLKIMDVPIPRPLSNK